MVTGNVIWLDFFRREPALTVPDCLRWRLSAVPERRCIIQIKSRVKRLAGWKVHSRPECALMQKQKPAKTV
jgi:hypothetical protein